MIGGFLCSFKPGKVVVDLELGGDGHYSSVFHHVGKRDFLPGAHSPDQQVSCADGPWRVMKAEITD